MADYIIDLTQHSDSYLALYGAAEADRAWFLTAPTWEDKYAPARWGSSHRTVGGGVVLQSYPRLTTGMPVTLTSDEKNGLIFDVMADRMRMLLGSGSLLEFSEDAGVTRTAVRPDFSHEPPLDIKPIDAYYKRVWSGTIYLVRA